MRDTLKRKILLFQKLVPSYRVPIFRQLYKQYGVIVCHSLERQNGSWKSSYEKMDYPNVLMKRLYYRKRDTSIIQTIIPALLKHKPKIVISEFSLGYLSFWILFLLRPLFRYKLAVWTHGINNKDMLFPFTSKKSKFELMIFKIVDGILLYSQERKKILSEKMSNDSKLFVAPNTLDIEPSNHYYRELKKIGISSIKRELGFKHKFNIIFIGRLLKNKGIDLLLSAFELLLKRHDICLHFIGDGPEIKSICKYKMKIQSIYAYGAIYDEDVIGKYLFASDLMVMPGYIGLGIVHSFCYGTPVISCEMTENGPFHSPEIEYLHHGENGLLCELNIDSLSKNIACLLNNRSLLKNMSQNAIETAQKECSVSKMIKGFEQLIFSLGHPPNDTAF